MSDINVQNKFKKLRNTTRSIQTLATDSLVKRLYFDERQFPLVIEPSRLNVNLVSWVTSNQKQLNEDLLRHGAILFRNWHCESIEQFQQFVKSVTNRVMNYAGGAAIRSRVKDEVFTSSEYPNELQIRLHNEFCYSNNWPMKLFFFSLLPPNDGGQTPLIDSRKLYWVIHPRIRHQFEEKGILYVRNYKYNRSWQKSYQTQDKAGVEEICRKAEREFEWINEHDLKTWERRPAIQQHPITQEVVWFNFAHGFHVSRMDEMTRAALTRDNSQETDEMLWPNNAYYGDGSEIDGADIEEINQTIENNLVEFKWEKSDIIMLDNMLVAHGRRPFTGLRKILLQMAEPYLDIFTQSGYLVMG